MEQLSPLVSNFLFNTSYHGEVNPFPFPQGDVRADENGRPATSRQQHGRTNNTQAENSMLASQIHLTFFRVVRTAGKKIQSKWQQSDLGAFVLLAKHQYNKKDWEESTLINRSNKNYMDAYTARLSKKPPKYTLMMRGLPLGGECGRPAGAAEACAWELEVGEACFRANTSRTFW